MDTTYVVDVSDDDDAMVNNDSDAQVDDGMMMMDALIAVANTMLTDAHHGDTIAVADTMILPGDESPAETIILPDDESSDDSVPDDVERCLLSGGSGRRIARHSDTACEPLEIRGQL